VIVYFFAPGVALKTDAMMLCLSDRIHGVRESPVRRSGGAWG